MIELTAFQARPTLIIFLWLAYAFYSFLGDVHYTLAQRRYRLEQTVGPFGTQIICTLSSPLLETSTGRAEQRSGSVQGVRVVGGFMMFLGLWRVLRM